MKIIHIFIRKYPKQTDIFILILGFILGAYFFVFIRIGGLPQEAQKGLIESYEFHYMVPLLVGLCISLVLVFIEFKVYPHLFLNKSALFVMGAKSLFLSSIILLNTLVIQISFSTLVYGTTFKDAWAVSLQFIQSEIYVPLFVYLFLVGIVLNFFRALGNRFGHGILVNYIIGKYREPVEEHRIFLFIDMNKSTTIAEELGHVKYSRLLNVCFNELANSLKKCGGDIYQFVGDEAIVTWKMDEITDVQTPIVLYQDFKRRIFIRSEKFMEAFGLVPGFKASINMGAVVVSEIGDKKKEIAYHGDVLNTSARILERCSKLKKELMTTESYLNLFKQNLTTEIIYIEDLILRGKKSSTRIYHIQLKEEKKNPL